MTTDRPTARGPGPSSHRPPEAQVQLDELHRLILRCRQDTDEADLLIRQSARLLQSSETCLKNSAAPVASRGATDHVPRSD